MGRRVDGSLGTLLQGVSQQPVRQRLAGQVTEQINMTSDVVRMLHRRAPTQYLGSFDIGAIDTDKTFVHDFELSDGIPYYLVIPPNATEGILINANTGVKITTVTWSTQFISYVSVADPKSTLKAITVGDLTYIINTSTTVAMTADLSPGTFAGGSSIFISDSARVDVGVGQYNRDYSVTVTVGGSDYTITHGTPASTASGAEADIAVDNIAAELVTLMVAEPGFNDNFNIKNQGSEIILWPKVDGTAYNFSGHDGIGGGALKITNKNTVDALIDLPTKAPADSIYLVKGADESADDIYMRFDVSLTSTGDPEAYFQVGTWVETIKPGIQYKLNQATMPHMLSPTGGGNFSAGSGSEVLTYEWAEQLVGDEDSNKQPEFIGATITDLTVYQDRLVLLSGENVSMSVTSDFFNFWKKTVTTLLDDGPVGLSAISDKVNNLRYAAAHDNALVVFADEAQFKIPGSPAITPKNATMTETTTFKIQTKVRPAPAGNNLFFAIDSGSYTGIREFYTDSDVDSNNATAVTVAVERYIEGQAKLLTSSTNLDKLAVLADADNILYLYEYLWDQEERVQEAWSTWQFEDTLTILNVNFGPDKLNMLAYIGTELHTLTISINTDTELVIGGDVYLDRRVAVTANTTATVTTLPNSVTAIDAIQGAGCPNPGLRAEIESYDGTTLTFKRDMYGGTVYVGVKYPSVVKPTMPRIRDNSGLVIGTSSLVLGEMFINFEDTGDFNVDISGEYTFTERNPGRVLGEESSTIGEYSLTRGTFPVPVRHSADKAEMTIYTDSPYPLTVVDIEWEGQFYKRGTRMTRPG